VHRNDGASELAVARERARLGIKAEGAFSWRVEQPFPRGDGIAALMHNPSPRDFEKRYGPGATARSIGSQ
jgi:hypothetical protein